MDLRYIMRTVREDQNKVLSEPCLFLDCITVVNVKTNTALR